MVPPWTHELLFLPATSTDPRSPPAAISTSGPAFLKTPNQDLPPWASESTPSCLLWLTYSTYTTGKCIHCLRSVESFLQFFAWFVCLSYCSASFLAPWEYKLAPLQCIRGQYLCSVTAQDNNKCAKWKCVGGRGHTARWLLGAKPYFYHIGLCRYRSLAIEEFCAHFLL